MPSEHSDLSGPFEEELSDALRRTGDGFSSDRPAGLVDAGMARGRRAVRRRRIAAVTGSVAALALVGTVGAYAGGLVGGGSTGEVSVAGPAPVSPAVPPAPSQGRTGSGAVSPDEMIQTFKSVLSVGELVEVEARGTADELGPAVFGVIDDGKGKAAITLSLNRVDPGSESSRQQIECPDQTYVPHDACNSKKLDDGSTLMLFQGYEYPDRRVDTKVWRATLVTPQGYLVDVSEWNAPAQKDAEISRPNPPLSPAQLGALATSPKWHKALNDLPAAGSVEEPADVPKTDPAEFSALFKSLLPEGLTTSTEGGQVDSAYVTVNDGKGKSLVEVGVQRGMGSVLDDLKQTGEVTTLPDGTTVIERRGAGDKDVAGAVMWTADVMRKNGDRVMVSALNSDTHHNAPTRSEPALSMKQLRAIALSDKWYDLEGMQGR
ncbi:hypothetical protein J7E96_23855 [Streptomyces sp. ISL-96]|uniref:hypothetical protein n=1 Tax=Streptomyces sp. ISL-96 TaxID=2819191 RepID=UPI001BEC6A57|nr:hypothetical protein [Streptomyces sp. ISL-96]MBT2491504.1 hypothetical protein [Streptomyces sp. ISL-96]